MIRLISALVIWLLPLPAAACRLALVLGIDVSHSIDNFEFQMQVSGTAEALRDPVIASAMIDMQVAVSVVQWSGSDQQLVSVPWMRIRSARDLALLERQVRNMVRNWNDSNTAVGAALQVMTELFPAVPDCDRRVIDFSGDGISNAGPLPLDARHRARNDGIMINGLAIDRVGRSVTEYFRRHVIIGPGAFVVTARGYRDYPRAIREKLFRELLPPSS